MPLLGPNLLDQDPRVADYIDRPRSDQRDPDDARTKQRYPIGNARDKSDSIKMCWSHETMFNDYKC
jgi:hypothetical protein